MNEVLSLGRMARRIGVSRQWLRERAAVGDVPSLKAGTRYLFNPMAVEATLAAKAASPTKGVPHAQ